ncbi:MAG: ATP-dependent DNA helicase [bacterium]
MYKLNQSQQQAVEYNQGPLIIVAGAGTGKTTVITQKIVYLLQNELAKPEQILALVFNDKAADEIQERVDEIIDIGYIDMQISTFHSFCQQILEQYGLDIGIPNNFKILTQTDAWILIKKKLDKFGLDYYRPLGNPGKHIHELIKHFSKCKDELIDPQAYLEYAEDVKLDKDNDNQDEHDRLTEIANAYHVYNRLLLEHNSLDFGDLIYYAVKLLKKRPQVLKQLQERFKYILVDEFQDVNWAQYELVRKLGENGQLTVVGDDDQSIYAFRGASVANILRFKDDYQKVKEIVLTENYRSGQKILDKAYESIKNNNPDRLETKLRIDKKLKSMVDFKAEVVHAHKFSLEEEVKFVIDEIIKLKTQDQQASLDDFAILVRANNHAEPFMAGLESHGIAYEFLASNGLYRQPIILDCLNFFKLLDNYHESTAIYRLLRLPIWRITENDLQKITYTAKRKSISYYEALKRAQEFALSESGTTICGKLLNLIHDGMKQASIEKPHRVLYDFLERSGYLKYLMHEEGANNRLVIRQIHQLIQFFEYLTRYEENIADARVSDFMDQFNYLLESGEQGSLYQPADTPDSVNIITIHKSKGLEFKYVFVVNMVEDRFPTRRRGNGIELPIELVKEQLPEGDPHIQEERRLFYVACTRAKQKLYLTSASNYGGVRKKKISRFLHELDYQAQDQKLEKKSNFPEYPKSFINTKQTSTYKIPSSFSFSQIKSYNTCPYQYKLGNIIKLPMKQSHYFSFGNSIHNSLQKFYQRIIDLNQTKQESLFGLPGKKEDHDHAIKVPSLDELMEIYNQSWIEDWFQDKNQREEYFVDGQKMLKEYYKQNQDNWTIPAGLESGFKIRIDDFILMGRIDRIDQLADQSLHIIDYKTGQSKEKPQSEDKEQLIIYQIAVESLPEYRNLGKASKLTLYFVKDGVQASFLASDKEIEKLKEKIINTVQEIKKMNFTPNPSQYICNNCHYRDICEYKI